MDFGRKYMNRIFIYSSTFLACYLFYAIVILLRFFEFISIELSFVSNAYAMFDIFIVLVSVLLMLGYGAQINHQYIEDKMQLVKIKQTMLFIKINIDRVIHEDSKETSQFELKGLS